MNRSLTIFIYILLFISCDNDSDEPITALKANFSTDKTNIAQGGQVTFQDLTTGGPTSWNWAFQGGTPSTSNEKDPVVSFNQAGSFEVSLTVSKEGSEDNITKSNLIQVDPITINFENQAFKLIENAEEGKEVGQIIANTNSAINTLKYEIKSGNTDNALALDSDSGILTVANSSVLDFETIPSISLEIEVSSQDVVETRSVTIDLINLIENDELLSSEPCKLENVFTFDFVGAGFPNTNAASTLGTVNVQVLFTDFSEAPSTKTTNEVFDILSPINNEFFNEMSYGKMQVNFTPYHAWLRLSQPPLHYLEGLTSASGHLAFIQEAVDLADSEVDFSDTDIVVVMVNPDVTEISFGPAFGSLNDDFAIKADGKSIRAGVTSGYDLNFWGGIWLAHEMGHNLGLPDLYSYFDNGQEAHKYVGTFGVMGLISGNAPSFFAYERWLLGWLDDSQVYCHGNGEVAIELNQVATSGGVKAAMIPLSNTKALVVESRRKVGFDSNLTKEGALVYVVDAAVERGRGPFDIKPNVNSGDMKEDAPMVKGDVYSYEGIKIEVIDSKDESDVVLITNQ